MDCSVVHQQCGLSLLLLYQLVIIIIIVSQYKLAVNEKSWWFKGILYIRVVSSEYWFFRAKAVKAGSTTLGLC